MCRGDLGCERGYEFWLLEQARARNPNILTCKDPFCSKSLDRRVVCHVEQYGHVSNVLTLTSQML